MNEREQRRKKTRGYREDGTMLSKKPKWSRLGIKPKVSSRTQPLPQHVKEREAAKKRAKAKAEIAEIREELEESVRERE